MFFIVTDGSTHGYLVPYMSVYNTSPRIDSRADFLPNQGGTNNENGGFRKISSRHFHRRVARHFNSTGSPENRHRNSSQGACYTPSYQVYGINRRTRHVLSAEYSSRSGERTVLNRLSPASRAQVHEYRRGTREEGTVEIPRRTLETVPRCAYRCGGDKGTDCCVATSQRVFHIL